MMRSIHKTNFVIRNLVLIVFMEFVLFSCGYSDPFYGKGSGWDYVRFPLLKPYYAMSLANDELIWVIPLERELPLRKESFLIQISDVRKIAVADNAVMAYSPDSTKIASDNVEEKIFHWFILIPDESLEMGFENEDDFLNYIRQNNMSEPQWLAPIEILQKFDKTGCLDWIPECQ
jgi:hypothetical protein